MSAVNNLLDKYREACSLTSDSAAADSLGIKRQALHQWRKGLSWPSEDHIVEMATKIGDAPEKWLVSVSIDRAPPKARKYWMKLPQAAAALVLALGVAPSGHASIASAGYSAHEAAPVYIMRSQGSPPGLAEVLLLALLAVALVLAVYARGASRRMASGSCVIVAS